MNKLLDLSGKDLKYLKDLVKNEFEKFDEVASVSRDPEIKEERDLLRNLNQKLSV